MNKTSVLFFAVRTCAGVMTVTRGHYLGFPVYENDGQPLVTQARRAIDSRAIIRNLGRHELLCSFKSNWNGEERNIEIHFFPQAVIVTLVNVMNERAFWIQPESDDERLDNIAKQAFKALQQTTELPLQTAQEVA